jgi:O-antigen/teichoic acid export membrane protein
MQKIRDYFSEMASSEFYRNIAGLFSGIFAARLIPAGFALIIARIYSPENFGTFVLFLSIASLVSILVTGGYERAILLAGTLEKKQHLFRFSLKSNLIANSLLLSGIIIYLLLTGKFSGSNTAMIILIPVFAFFFGGLQLIRNILISNKLFRKLSELEIIRASATGILQSLLFIFPGTGLFIGIVVAQALTYLYYAKRLPEVSSFRFLKYSSRELALARRYKNFPKYSVPSEMLNYFSSQLAVFLIKPFFGGTMLGLYSFSHRYISIPVQLTSISIGTVYVQKAQSLKKEPSELAGLTYGLFRKQFLLAVVPFTILALWGNGIFRFIFGAEWEYSGTLAQLTAPWLFAVFIGSPLANILIVMEKQRISLIFNILMLIFRALALVVGGLILKDVILAVALYSFTGLFFFSLLTVYSLHLASVNLGRAFRFSAIALTAVLLPLLILKLWL